MLESKKVQNLAKMCTVYIHPIFYSHLATLATSFGQSV